MIYSSLVKKHYELSTIAGLVSMISFIILYFIIGKDINQTPSLPDARPRSDRFRCDQGFWF